MSDPEPLVRRMLAACAAYDAEALRACLHPEIVVHRPLPDIGVPGTPNDAGSYHGLDEVLPLLRGISERTGGIEFDLRTIEPLSEGSVLFEFIASMGSEESRTAWLGWSLFGFRDGLIASTETFATERSAREAIAAGAGTTPG